MMQGLHSPFSSLSDAALCASALEEMDEKTDHLFSSGCSWMKTRLQANRF